MNFFQLAWTTWKHPRISELVGGEKSSTVLEC